MSLWLNLPALPFLVTGQPNKANVAPILSLLYGLAAFLTSIGLIYSASGVINFIGLSPRALSEKMPLNTHLEQTHTNAAEWTQSVAIPASVLSYGFFIVAAFVEAFQTKPNDSLKPKQ